MYFKSQFLCEITNPISLPSVLLYVEYFCPLWLCLILSHFSHNRPNWSSRSFSSPTFQKFSHNTDLPSEVSQFQHHTILSSKCSTSLISSLNLSPVSWETEFSYCWMLLLHDNSGFNFTCTSCIICYHATQNEKYCTFSNRFWFIIISNGGGSLNILITYFTVRIICPHILKSPYTLQELHW
jgi:hypothetical protein